MVASVRKTVRDLVFKNRQLAQLYYSLSLTQPVLPHWLVMTSIAPNLPGDCNLICVHVTWN